MCGRLFYMEIDANIYPSEYINQLFLFRATGHNIYNGQLKTEYSNHSSQYLHFYPYASPGHNPIDLCIPLEYCPRFGAPRLPTMRLLQIHPTLKSIDFRNSKQSNYKPPAGLNKSHCTRTFPALRSLRKLDSGLLSAVDWPLLFPREKYADGSLEYQYPVVHIRIITEQIVRIWLGNMIHLKIETIQIHRQQERSPLQCK